MDALRKLLAVLIALRGLTNFAKPFGGGFVILGRLMHGGVATTVVAPVVGVVMLVYAYGLWQARSWALPLGMYVLFAVPGIVAPWLAVWLLGRRRV
jgi:hypothetical protein